MKLLKVHSKVLLVVLDLCLKIKNMSAKLTQVVCRICPSVLERLNPMAKAAHMAAVQWSGGYTTLNRNIYRALTLKLLSLSLPFVARIALPVQSGLQLDAISNKVNHSFRAILLHQKCPIVSIL